MRLVPMFLGVALAAHVLIFLFSLEMATRADGPSHGLIALHATALLALGFSLLGLARKEKEPPAQEAPSEDFAFAIDERFTDWKLTPAERDVAWFTMKGLSIGEIAAVRGTSEGTVKAQGNAIYRKAGVAGRVQLLAAFMDELILSGDSSRSDERSVKAS